MTCRWTSALPEDEACKCSAGNIDSARIAAIAHTATPILTGRVFNKDRQYTGRIGPEVKTLRVHRAFAACIAVRPCGLCVPRSVDDGERAVGVGDGGQAAPGRNLCGVGTFHKSPLKIM